MKSLKNELPEKDKMSKILIVGAGGQGGPCASFLSRVDEVSEIRLGDINAELAAKVAEKIGRSKVKPLKLDASRKENIAGAADDVHAIINLTLIDFNDLKTGAMKQSPYSAGQKIINSRSLSAGYSSPPIPMKNRIPCPIISARVLRKWISNIRSIRWRAPLSKWDLPTMTKWMSRESMWYRETFS
jgi:hypothetical protein